MKKKQLKTLFHVDPQASSLHEASGDATPVLLKKQWSLDEPEAILDYLHGDTPADRLKTSDDKHIRRQVKACCYYEYARTSEVLQKARQRFDPTDGVSLQTFLHTIALGLEDFCTLLKDWSRLEILICDGYPELPWRYLDATQKEDICLQFANPRVMPVITNSFVLEKMGVFDRFKEQADAARRECLKRPLGGGQYPAIIGNDAVKYAVLTLDYRKGKDALVNVLSSWLDSDLNRRSFKEFYKKPIDKQNPDSPDRYKELLKYLAAWRLYDELGFKEAKEWTSKYRRRKDYHPRPFFSEKLRKTPNGLHYRGPVFKERRQWESAIDKARSFLAETIERQRGMT